MTHTACVPKHGLTLMHFKAQDLGRLKKRLFQLVCQLCVKLLPRFFFAAMLLSSDGIFCMRCQYALVSLEGGGAW